MRLLGLLLAATLLNAADFSKFSKDVQPLLEQNCTGCHGAIKQLGGVRLDTPSGFAKATREGVLAAIESGRMPPGEKLDSTALREWLKSDAAWPDGVVIATGGAGAGGADNMALVRHIHDLMAAAPQSMTAYKTVIPGTDVSYEMVPIPGRDLWMSAHEVTWDEYRLFMFANQAGEGAMKDPRVDAVSRPTRPYVEMSFGMGINGFPAISMTQHAANKYAEWLSATTGQFYRLPTEAEWEYACRASSQTAPSNLADYAWFADNSDGKYQKIATKKPNAWGLYDMLGNVMEWTLGGYARGGSWADDAAKCTCGSRVASDPTWQQQDPQLPKSIWYLTDAQWLGFRLVRTLKVPTAEEMFRYWNE